MYSIIFASLMKAAALAVEVIHYNKALTSRSRTALSAQVDRVDVVWGPFVETLRGARPANEGREDAAGMSHRDRKSACMAIQVFVS